MDRSESSAERRASERPSDRVTFERNHINGLAIGWVTQPTYMNFNVTSLQPYELQPEPDLWYARAHARP